MNDNLTFDLETLGNTHQAPIVQIGSVKFKDSGEIIDTFVRYINIESLSKHPQFKVDYSTLQWWFSQEDLAIKSVMCVEGSISLKQALYEFSQWIGKPSDYVFWSHATFDPPILNFNFLAVGMQNPIPFRAHRDIRTLTHFSGKIEVEREGIHHNALDDCLHQAKYISKGLQKILKV